MKNIIIIALVLFLSGCSLFNTKKLEVTTIAQEKPELILPSVDRYNAKPVKWIVITPQNVSKVFMDLQKQKGNVVLIGLTDKGYENLTLNTADLLKILQQYKAVIAAYKEYYSTEDSE